MHNKIINGFVTQTYEGSKCTSQTFTAGDPVDYEDEYGDPVEVDTSKEVYQPMDMKQPLSDEQIANLGAGISIKLGLVMNDGKADTPFGKKSLLGIGQMVLDAVKKVESK